MSLVDVKRLTARIDALERSVSAMDARLTVFEGLQTACVAAIDQRCVGVRASLHADVRALCDVIKAELRDVLKDDVSRSLQPFIREATRVAVTEAVRSHTLTVADAPS